MGVIRNKKLKPEEQYTTVDDTKLRLTLAIMADRFSQQTREEIYRTYNDPTILSLYKAWRDSGVFNQGSKTGARHKKIIEIPSPKIMDFLNAVFGTNWINDSRAINHELVKVWWVVHKI